MTTGLEMATLHTNESTAMFDGGASDPLDIVRTAPRGDQLWDLVCMCKYIVRSDWSVSFS